MSDYTVQASWGTKDALAAGQALKGISATELGTEFDAIATAILSKHDSGDIASTAEAEALTSTTKLLTPSTLNDVLVANGGMLKDIQALADPNEDRILGWDDSAGEIVAFQLGNGLESSGTAVRLILNELNTEASIAAGDFIAMVDVTDNGSGKITFANFESALNHDSLTGFVSNEHIDHSGVDITAGTGLTGGGSITTTRTLNLDISSLPSRDISQLVSPDGVLVDDGGTMTRISKQDMGIQVSIEGANSTYDATDANQIHVLNDPAMTVTIPATTYPVGAVIYFAVNGTGTITINPASTVTFNSTIAQSSTANRTVSPGGMAAMVQVATNVWNLVGDIA